MIDCEAPNVDSDTVFIWNKDLEHLFSKYGVYIVASYDGLVCLATMYTQELAFCNPLTSAFKKLSGNSCSPRFFYKPSCTLYPLWYSSDKISMPPSSSNVIGFYIDSSNDYKILHMVSNGALGAYVYSLRTDSWRKIEYLVDNADYGFVGTAFEDQQKEDKNTGTSIVEEFDLDKDIAKYLMTRKEEYEEENTNMKIRRTRLKQLGGIVGR
nr:hypothetical protein [Tanacetum cinerariifolium]